MSDLGTVSLIAAISAIVAFVILYPVGYAIGLWLALEFSLWRDRRKFDREMRKRREQHER